MPVDTRPVDASHGQVLPLDSRVEYVQNVIEYLEVRELWFLSLALREVREDALIELFLCDFRWQGIVYWWWSLRLFDRFRLLVGSHKKCG